MHHLFLRVAKIQPKSGQGHSSCPPTQAARAAAVCPRALGITGWGYSPCSPFRDRKGAA